MVKAIVGANWGDEGKGKITDMLAAQSDVIIRFQGGANAGHTIINDYGKFALHTLPSGVFYKHTMNIVGNGVALHIPTFINEVNAIVEQGAPQPQLMVSDRAQMMMPYHILLDTYEENRLKDRQFGSTKSGIAPFYADKYSKIGFQVCELFDETSLRAKLERVLEVKNILITHLYRQPALSADEIFAEMMDWREQIRPYVQDSVAYVQQAEKQGKTILLEGSSAQVRLLPVTGSSAAVTQAYVQGSTATVFLTSRQLRAATNAQSGATVTVNATDPVADTVILAGRSIANARSAGVAALQVQLAAGTVTLDSAALAALDLHKDVAVSLTGASLNAAQQRALGTQAATATLANASVTVDGAAESYPAGSVRASVPARAADALTAWSLAEDGAISVRGMRSSRPIPLMLSPA